MNKMVYEMNVEWNWIKQRPHFLAEELSRYFDLTVLYQYRYNRKGLQHREVQGEKLKPVRVIPGIGRSLKLHQINVAWVKLRFADWIRRLSPEYVYVTRPEMVGSVRRYQGKVIYDCMDDYYAFSGEDWLRRKTFRDEKALVLRADYVLASSEKLRESLMERYGQQIGKKTYVVRNGFGGEILPGRQEGAANRTGRYTFCYFGTIDTWFNFDFLLRSLEDFPDIEYMLIGPAKVKIPQHDRIRYLGTVEHDRLPEATAEADCFIMPFHVNDIIKAVDPVKLYEYVNLDKNIICVHYAEVERFSKFVHFYKDYDSFAEQIRSLTEHPEISYGEEERKAFLQENSWEARAAMIVRILASRI